MRKMIRSNRGITLTLVAVVIGLSAAVGVSALAATPSPSSRAGMTAIPGTATITNAATPWNAFFPSDATYPPTLQAAINSLSTRHANAVEEETRQPNHPSIQSRATTPSPTPQVDLGIIQEKETGPFGRGATIANRWQGIEDGQVVTVFAGALASDPSQGFVGVTKSPAGSPFNKPQVVLTPIKHGFLKITAVNGTVFTLVAKDGTMFTFDRSTATFK